MKVFVNGDGVTCEDGISLEKLIKELGYQKDRIAAEVDGEIIRKSEFDSCILKPSCTVEIVTFMGGG